MLDRGLEEEITMLNREHWKNTDKLRCPKCRSTRLFKDGFTHDKQRYRCKNKSCGAVTIAPKMPKKVQGG